MVGGRRVVFVMFDGMKMLDVTGPAEVFAEANLLGGAYGLAYVSVSGGPVVASNGMELAAAEVADCGEADSVVIAGGDCLVGRPVPAGLIAAIEQLRPRTRRMVSICTGSFALAAAGVLSGRRATTHWRHAELLARSYPDVRVQPDALFVEDDGVFTSAGVTAGMDLALALVERDHGVDLAREVARGLVMFMQRPGGQSQFSAPLRVRPPRTPALRTVVDLISAQPALDHSVNSLADRVGVGPRHLARLFAGELDTTPARYVEQVRLDHAKVLLDAGHTVAAAARSAGFGSSETMRRIFVARFGISPSQYRARFGTAAGGRRRDAD
ncbi:GlxA family transcriptional regulator [Nocardia sp. NEAU-G5]|uniref:GlxA family transcriptional regulator n=1 Tax=Nocardia albiluteola TaxID=2842303 RepID=A0ABS6AW30_9NOCA|nr:GlxA family transcriptional regulator [Nocardia albiluteola]MBU3062240.1 GlxA family transcriptional regulator [Nocardia albiluteola]